MAPSFGAANLVSVSGCKDRDNFLFSKQNGRKRTEKIERGDGVRAETCGTAVVTYLCSGRCLLDGGAACRWGEGSVAAPVPCLGADRRAPHVGV